MDISKEKKELIKSLKLLIYTYENLLIALLIPLIPLYAEFSFIKAAYNLNKKLKNLNIILYDNLFYLIEHSKLGNLLLLSVYSLLLLNALVLFTVCAPIFSCTFFLFYTYFEPKIPSSLIYYCSILIFIIIVIIHIYSFVSIFFISKYELNISQFCQGLYELTNNELFNKCAIDFLNPTITTKRRMKAIDFIYLHKKPLKSLSEIIETLPDKIDIIELK